MRFKCATSKNSGNVGANGDRRVVNETFVKFPRTPHLFWLGRTPPRADKALSTFEAEELLRRPAILEEKLMAHVSGFRCRRQEHCVYRIVALTSIRARILSSGLFG